MSDTRASGRASSVSSCSRSSSALFARLWYLQVAAADQFHAAATQQRGPRDQRARDPRPDPRRPGQRARRQPRRERHHGRPQDQRGRQASTVLEKLSALLGIPVAKLEATSNDPRISPYTPVPVATDVPYDKLAWVAEHKEELPGVHAEAVPVRRYPNGSLAVARARLRRRDQRGRAEDAAAEGRVRARRHDRQERRRAELRVGPARPRRRAPGRGRRRRARDPHAELDARRGRATTSGSRSTSTCRRPPRPRCSRASTRRATPRTRATRRASRRSRRRRARSWCSTRRPARSWRWRRSPTYDPNAVRARHPRGDVEAVAGQGQRVPAAGPGRRRPVRAGFDVQADDRDRRARRGDITATRTINDTGLVRVPHRPGPSVQGTTARHGRVDLNHALTVSSDVYFYTVGGDLYYRWKHQQPGGDALQATAREWGFGASTGIALPNEAIGPHPRRGVEAADPRREPGRVPVPRLAAGRQHPVGDRPGRRARHADPARATRTRRSPTAARGTRRGSPTRCYDAQRPQDPRPADDRPRPRGHPRAGDDPRRASPAWSRTRRARRRRRSPASRRAWPRARPAPRRCRASRTRRGSSGMTPAAGAEVRRARGGGGGRLRRADRGPDRARGHGAAQRPAGRTGRQRRAADGELSDRADGVGLDHRLGPPGAVAGVAAAPRRPVAVRRAARARRARAADGVLGDAPQARGGGRSTRSTS